MTLPPETLAVRVAEVFEGIHREQMAGLPLLNEALSVATLGFQSWQGRVLGMLVTPWMMSLVVFPGTEDRWENAAMGAKETLAFPGGSLRFMLNVIEGLGAVQMHSVHSPMRGFHGQAAAVAEAEVFLAKLLMPAGPDAVPEDPVNEELLGRILRGEKVPEVDAAVSGMAREVVQPVQ